MPKYYSKDLKLSIVKLYDNNYMNMTQIANFYNISRKSIYNWTNNIFIESKKYITTKKKITEQISDFILKYVLNKTLLIMPKLLKKINKNFNVNVSKSSIYNILKNNDVTYKKINIKKNIKGINNKGKITRWINNIKNENKNMIISLDESSIIINDYPRYGWNKKGEKAIIKSNKKNTIIRKNLLMAISTKKVIGYMLSDEPIKSDMFIQFLKEKINKKYKRSKLLLDNARIHHANNVKNYVNNNRLIYTIPYTPELNPIENIFSLIKNNLRKLYNSKLSIKEKIDKIIKDEINEQKLKSYFDHSLTHPFN